MDKDELKHLEDYKKEETSLAYRLKIVKGNIDRVEPITEYQKQNDTSLKEFDVIITTIENIEPEVDKNGIPIKKNKQA